MINITFEKLMVTLCVTCSVVHGEAIMIEWAGLQADLLSESQTIHRKQVYDTSALLWSNMDVDLEKEVNCRLYADIRASNSGESLLIGISNTTMHVLSFHIEFYDGRERSDLSAISDVSPKNTFLVLPHENLEIVSGFGSYDRVNICDFLLLGTAYPRSMYALLGNPDNYVNKYIRTEGYLVLTDYGCDLYCTQDDYDSNGVIDLFPVKLSEENRLFLINNRFTAGYVRLSGVFDRVRPLREINYKDYFYRSIDSLTILETGEVYIKGQ